MKRVYPEHKIIERKDAEGRKEYGVTYYDEETKTWHEPIMARVTTKKWALKIWKEDWKIQHDITS